MSHHVPPAQPQKHLLNGPDNNAVLAIMGNNFVPRVGRAAVVIRQRMGIDPSEVSPQTDELYFRRV
jgi:hypothetical protein